MPDNTWIGDFIRQQWPVVGDVLTHWGRTVASLCIIATAVVLIWWKWPDISQRPGIPRLVSWWRRKRTIPAEAIHLTVALAHLDHDENGEHERLLRDALSHDFPGVRTIALDRTVSLRDAATEQLGVERASEQARTLLKDCKADVLLWGSVVSLAGKSAMRLYWTTAEPLAEARANGLYQDVPDTVALPSLFWDDLKQVLGLLAQSRLAELVFRETGHYVADRLLPLLDQVRHMLQAAQGDWQGDTLRNLQHAFATALLSYGQQAGDKAALVESIAVFREIVTRTPRDRLPLDWATLQSDLGSALAILGERKNDPETLRQAVGAYRQALSERTRQRVPLDWARTQNNLGNALQALGQRESDPETLRQAVEAYRQALSKRTRQRVPLDWAATQNNLGAALQALGQRESGTETLQQAVEAFRQALTEHTRQRGPLNWAITQNNLGNALAILGERESGTETLRQAVEALRQALTERTRQRDTLGWAARPRTILAMHSEPWGSGKATPKPCDRPSKPTGKPLPNARDSVFPPTGRRPRTISALHSKPSGNWKAAPKPCNRPSRPTGKPLPNAPGSTFPLTGRRHRIISALHWQF